MIVLDPGLRGGDGCLVGERPPSLLRVSDVPVIVLTARVPGGNPERARSLGAKAFLRKPVDGGIPGAAIRRAPGE